MSPSISFVSCFIYSFCLLSKCEQPLHPQHCNSVDLTKEKHSYPTCLQVWHSWRYLSVDGNIQKKIARSVLNIHKAFFLLSYYATQHIITAVCTAWASVIIISNLEVIWIYGRIAQAMCTSYAILLEVWASLDFPLPRGSGPNPTDTERWGQIFRDLRSI